MPVYEYKCSECGNIDEHLVSSSRDTPDLKCSRCGSTNMRKILSVPSVITGSSDKCPAGSQPCCGMEERCASPPCRGGGPYHGN